MVAADGDDVVVDAHGSRLGAPTVPRPPYGGHGLGGGPAREGVPGPSRQRDAPGGGNLLAGGVVSDVSFIGVSTQYLVRMPWGQELTVFEQNSGARDGFRPGDQVDLHWAPAHTFLLDADQDAHAGDESYAALTSGAPA